MVPRISREELKARLDSPDASSHPVILDVRLKYPYEHSTATLPGAQRLLPDAIATAPLPRDRDIVLYDSDPNNIVASQAAAELIRLGHRVFVLQGGINDWMTAKLPVDTKSAPQPAAPAAKAAPAAGTAAKPPVPGAATPAKPAAPAAAAAAPSATATVAAAKPDAPADTTAAAPKDSPPAALPPEGAAPGKASPATVEGAPTPATEPKP